jgi:hypothetical protein
MRVDVKGPVTSVYFDVSAGWEQTLYLSSDVHWDSIYCNRALFKQHMERMNKVNALGILAGDVLDLMQGRFDPRRSMEELRPEYRRNDYYDFVSDDAAKFFKPYAKNILLMARGNHELSVVKNANTDPFSNMVRELHRGGAQTVIGGFGGWIRLMFSVGGVPKTSLKIKYFHGAGSEAPVTRGVIQTNRQAVYLPDANIVLNGHNHNSYIVPIIRERISNKGVLYTDTQYHIRTPGYKQDYADGSGGWTVERGGVPKPIGCAWVRLVWQDDRVVVQPMIDICGPDMLAPITESRPEPFVYPEP